MNEQPITPDQTEQVQPMQPIEPLAPSVSFEAPVTTEPDTTSIGAVTVGNVVSEDDRPSVDKAWDMAYAGKPSRDAASRARKAVQTIQTGIDELPGTAIELQHPVEQKILAQREASDLQNETIKSNRENGTYEISSEQREKIYRARKKAEDHVAAVGDILAIKDPTIRHALELLVSRLTDGEDLNDALGSTERYYALSQNEAERFAEKKDDHADRLEYWAGILHDNAPSAAYKERYDLGDVTPESLIRVEDEVKAKDVELQRASNGIERFFNNDPSLLKTYAAEGEGMRLYDIFRGGKARDVDTIMLFGRNVQDLDDSGLLQGKSLGMLAYGNGSPEATEYEDTVVKDKPTSDEEYVRVYRSALERAFKNLTIPLRLQKTFLEDIRTGRAAQWQ